jgi:alkanesulfonate monooxygenase SsuD/methylene tetrahydromethanopterin reductase-like flavin-dependent oxidoreductase (luciferase family)
VPDALTIGLSLPNRAVLFGTPVSTLVEAARTAEASGLVDSIWVGDNFVSKPRLEAITLLSHLAAVTERVKLGTVCLATFPLRNIVQLAIQWGSLDVLSGGRTILAVCNGVPASAGKKFADELAAFGIPSKERPARVVEGIELLRRLWSEDGPVTFDGRFTQLQDIEALPKPVGEVPIVIAANPWDAVDDAARGRIERRVARLADGWQVDGLPAEYFGRTWRRMQELAEEAGRPGALRTSSLHMMVNVQDTVEAGRAEAIAFLDRYYGKGYTADEQIEHWVAAGPPQQVAEHIQRFVDEGLTTPILRFASPDQAGQLDRCLAEVLPLLGVTAHA